MVDPITASGALSANSGLFGGGSAQPQPAEVFTAEMADNAVRYIQNAAARNNQEGGTLSRAPNGVSTKQAKELSAKEQRLAAYEQFLQQEKGYSPEEAKKQARKVGNDPKKQLGNFKGFTEWAKSNTDFKFQKKAGGGTKITPGVAFDSAEVNVSPESNALADMIKAFNANSIESANGLVPMYAGDEMRALQSRNNLGMNIQNQLYQAQNQNGLTKTGQAQVNAIRNKYMNDFQDVYKRTMRQTMGGLAESGFGSSNLAGQMLNDTAFQTQNDFLTDAMAKMAGVEDQLMNSANSRNAQNITNSINGFNSLGQSGGLASVMGGMINPAQLGMFTDPQAAEAAFNNQQAGIGNRQVDQGRFLDTLLRPVTVMPDSNPLSFLSGIGAAQ